MVKHAGHENEENDNQRQTVLMFNQILSTSIITNVWRALKRICTLILGLKGLTLTTSGWLTLPFAPKLTPTPAGLKNAQLTAQGRKQ